MSKRPIILTSLKQFSKFAPLPLQNFGVDLKFDYIPLYVYYYSWIMQSLVFLTYFVQKLQRNTFGGSAQAPPLVQEG